MGSLQIAVNDVITTLQKEVAVRPAMKWHFALKLTFRKAVDQDVVTNPTIVLNMNPKTGFAATNYEHDLNEAMEDIK